jgi:hypothetical protein
MLPTEAHVQGMAPDAGAAANGRKLAAARHWKNLGRDERALWGECQGSALYQVRVDLADCATACTCPSRKFPCKHALGLLFLAAGSAGELAEGPAPEWVDAWLSKRAASAQAKETRAAAPAKPPDAKQQAARAARREARVDEGLDVLEAFLADLARQGLAGVERQPRRFWEDQAARLVDAQAAGLAGRVRRLAEEATSGAGWEERLVAQVGKLALVAQAYRRLATLPAPLQADVRQYVGFTVSEDQVQAHGDLVRDTWDVLGRRREPQPGPQKLVMHRTWLQGRATGRSALVMAFQVGASPDPTAAFVPGAALEAELAFYPSAWPQRALANAPAQVPGREPMGGPIATLLETFTDALAVQPWLDRVPAVLADVVLVPGPWHALDPAGNALPLVGPAPWGLLAEAGGRPFTLTAEWDGHALRPLGAWIAGRYVAVGVEEAG